MCLISEELKPQISNRSIHIRKMLCKVIERNLNGDITEYYRTPFLDAPIEFKNGYCVQTCKFFGIYPITETAIQVNEGIHSTIEKDSPFNSLKHAVIPKGTFYYRSYMNENYVSLKLVVFET